MVELDENCEADLSTDALGYATQTSSDGCDSDLTVETDYSDSAPQYTCSGDDDQLDGSYVFIRTFSFTVTDDCGNSTSTSVDQLITVQDNVDPSQTIETLDPVTLYLDGDCATDRSDAATGIPAITTDDNCDSDVANVLTYRTARTSTPVTVVTATPRAATPSRGRGPVWPRTTAATRTQ